VLGQDMPLRLATAPLDVSAQPYYALKYGFFKNAGLTNVTLETIATGAAMAAAVAGGAIDIAVSTSSVWRKPTNTTFRSR